MTAAEFVATVRSLDTDTVPDELVELYKFFPVQEANGRIVDTNIDSRVAVVEELYHDFSLKDIHLIRSLLCEEMAFDDAIGVHVCILQLCYYLYELAQLEDVFVVYDCKYNTGTMDVGCIMDREMLMMRHNVNEVIKYVTDRFEEDPSLKEKREHLIPLLHDLQKEWEYEDVDKYTQYIRDYIEGNRNSLDYFEYYPGQ